MFETYTPPLTATHHELPFDKLSSRDFERLSLWLIEHEGFNQVQHLGAAGADQGIDIIGYRNDVKWAFQCKRWNRFRTSEAIADFNKVMTLNKKEQPLVYVLVVPCDVSKKARDKLRSHSEGKIEYRFWAGAELDKKVKSYSDILREFFQYPANTSTTNTELSNDKHVLLSILKIRAGFITQNFDRCRERVEEADYIPGLVFLGIHEKMELPEAKKYLLKEIANSKRQFLELHERHLQAILGNRLTLAHDIVGQIHNILCHFDNNYRLAFKHPLIAYRWHTSIPPEFAKVYPGSPMKSFSPKLNSQLFEGWKHCWLQDTAIERIRLLEKLKAPLSSTGKANEKRLSIRGIFQEGKNLYNAGEYESALEKFDMAIGLMEDDATSDKSIASDIFFARGVVLEDLHRYGESLYAYDRANAYLDESFCSFKNILVRDIQLNTGCVLAKLERYKDAVNVLDAIDTRFFSSNHFIKRARSYDQCNCKAKAKKDYIKAAESILDKWKYSLRIDEAEEAIIRIDQALEFHSTSARAHCFKGICLKLLGHYDEALVELSRAIELNLDYAEAYTSRSLTLLELNCPLEAIDDCNMAIRLISHFETPYEAYKAYECRGLALINLGRHMESLDAFDNAVRLLKENKINTYEMHLWKARVFLHLSQYNEALEECERSIRNRESNPESHYYRATILNKLKRYPESVGSCYKAIKLKDDYASAYLELGVAFSGLLNQQEALMAFNMAVLIEPDLLKSKY